MSGDERLVATDLHGVKIGVVASVPFFLAAQMKGRLLDIRARGAVVTVVSAMGPELAQIEWGERLEHVTVDIRRKPAPWHDLIALFKMIWLFRRRRFHIVHSTTPKAGLLTAVSAWVAMVPLRLHTFTGQQWVTMSGPLRWISRWSDRIIAMLNTRVYADSPSQRQFLIDESIVPAGRIGVIGAGSLSGVDLQRFSRDRITDGQREAFRKELGIASDAMVVTFIGRITRDKGVYELLQAVRTLHEEGTSFDLILIGPMDSALESGQGTQTNPIDELLHGLSNIHAVGYTDAPERYLAITDVLCLPSYREGFGTVVIEAAAMGIPTVGTRITGLIDAVIDEVTGLLVLPRDAGALAVALRRMIVDPGLRRRLGDAARQRCVEQFDSSIVNRKLAEEYARLLTMTQPRAEHDR